LSEVGLGQLASSAYPGDCIHTSDGLGAVTKVTTDKQSNNYILDIIEAAIADESNGNLEVFYNDSKVE